MPPLPPISCPMPSSDAIWVEIPKDHYKRIQPRSSIPVVDGQSTIKEYPSDAPSLVKQGNYQ